MGRGGGWAMSLLPHARRPGAYLRRQTRAARRRALGAGLATLLLLALVLVGMPALLAVAPPRFAVAATVTVLLLALAAAGVARRAVGRARRFRVGARGEDALQRALARGLGDDYTLYRNLRLPGRGGDIDALLLGPPGLVLLENKAYRGEFVLFGDRWYRAAAPGSRDLRAWADSPSAQAAGNAARLAGWLAGLGPDLAAIPIHPLVVLSSGRVREQRKRPSVPVVPLADLARQVRRLPRARGVSRRAWEGLAAALDEVNEEE